MAFDREKEEQERIQLLDEIRKRAEDAELARIEAEEAKLAQSFSVESLAPPQRPIRQGRLRPVDQDEPVAPLLLSEEPLNQSSTFSDYVSIRPRNALPDPVQHSNAEQTQEPMQQQHQKKAASQSEGSSPAQKKKRIGEYLVAAQEHYNSEHYNRALLDLESIFEIDPNHAEAAKLYEDVEKAKALSELIQEEEQRRLATTETTAQSSVPAPMPALAAGKQSSATPTQRLLEYTDERKAPLSFEEPPTVKETFRRVFMVGGVLLCGIVAVVAYNTIFPKVFPKNASLLVLPPVAKNVDRQVTDGLMDEMVSYLSHVKSLKVYSANTTLGVYNSDGVKTAQRYGADYVLQWSVSEIDGLVNAKLSLIDAATSSTMLDMPFRILHSKLAGFSAGVVPEVAQALHLDATDLSAFRVTSSNQAAFDAYAKGRFLLNHPGSVSLDSVATVFASAAEADPSYPFAETMLGWTNILIHSSLQDTSTVYLTRAGKHLQRAMNLGDGSSQAYRLWGTLEFFRGAYSNAIQRLEQATTLASSDAEAHHWLARAYLHTGNTERALEETYAAADVDPRNPVFQSSIGLMELYSANPKRALEAFELSNQLKEDGSSLYSDEYLAALVAANQHERALDILRKRVNSQPQNFVAHYDLGRMLQLAGKSKGDWEAALQRARQVIVDTLSRNSSYALAHSYLALVETRLGNFASAARENTQAITLAPLDITILYNSARVATLQRMEAREIFSRLEKAAKVRFVFERALDLDFLTLRKDPQFVRKIVQ